MVISFKVILILWQLSSSLRATHLSSFEVHCRAPQACEDQVLLLGQGVPKHKANLFVGCFSQEPTFFCVNYVGAPIYANAQSPLDFRISA